MFFFFTDSATPEIYTLSLLDALPISWEWRLRMLLKRTKFRARIRIYLPTIVIRKQSRQERKVDFNRKSTRLNSSHVAISYAVFCLKKKIIMKDEIYY